MRLTFHTQSEKHWEY